MGAFAHYPRGVTPPQNHNHRGGGATYGSAYQPQPPLQQEYGGKTAHQQAVDASASASASPVPSPTRHSQETTAYPPSAYESGPGSTSIAGGGSVRRTNSADSSSSLSNVDEQDIREIFQATRHGRASEVTRLLEKGVPVNVKDTFGNTMLAIACQNGLKKIAKIALRRGADINSRNYKGNTPLHFCYTYGYGDSLGTYLISKGADPDIRNHTGHVCFDGLGGPNSAKK